jgi:hypothetical protein
MYSSTLANGHNRGLMVMGHDASMRVGGGLTVIGRRRVHALQGQDRRGRDRRVPAHVHLPAGFRGIDAVTSATAEYFASRGLLYTYRGGRRVSAYHLLLAEWLDVIRNGGQTSCDIEAGFEEAITSHMATRSYLEGRKVRWDPVRRRIV